MENNDMKILRLLFLLLLISAFATVVGGEEKQYYYTRHISPIAGTHCMGCHCSIFQFMCTYEAFVNFKSEIDPTGGLPVVYKGRPDSSVVMWRLIGETPSGETLEPMPFGSPRLSDTDKTSFGEWIRQGAVYQAEVGVEKNEKNWGDIKTMFR